MIVASVFFVAGVIALQQLPRLPDFVWSLPVLLLALVLCHRPQGRPAAWFLFGWFWAFALAMLAMQNRLDPRLEGKDIVVEGRILGIPESFERGYRFGFHIDSSDGIVNDSLPKKVRLSWYSPADTPLRADERWRFTVRLKQPHGTLNPGGFDYEQWLYLEGYGATGYVRKRPAPQRLDVSHLSLSIDRLRQSIALRLSALFRDNPFGGIVQALVIGEQDGITEAQWEVFRTTGTAHLVAISGLHIGLVAGLSLFVAKWLWVRIGSLRLSAPSVGAGCAIICAAVYSALAGFSVPTRRALIMILIVMGAILLRRKLAPGQTLAIALFMIVLYEPASVLSASLWLSFSAVAVITYVLAGRIGRLRRWTSIGKVHLATAAGLAPLLLVYFQQVSLIAPLANLIAVPVVSFVVVPCCLLGSILMLLIPETGIALLESAAVVLEILWRCLDWLSDLPFARWSGGRPSFIALILAAAGTMLFLAPRGIPARWLCVPMLLPVFLAPEDPPRTGEFRFTLLDVGQGLSAVVETARHTLVFDAGARFSSRFDMGSAVVAPFLLSRNVDSVNRLVISHGDNDHQGGAFSLNKQIAIGEIYTGPGHSIDWKPATECKAGQTWHWDGVEFRMLAPLTDSVRDNDNSCVLKITSHAKSLLLTGDIEKPTERALVERYGPELASDYLVVPHHGSNTSSTTGFLQAVRPSYALVPAGYRNRYGFPRREVVERLRRIGAAIYNTADSGALMIPPGAQKPLAAPLRYRTLARRYYHADLPEIMVTAPSTASADRFQARDIDG